MKKFDSFDKLAEFINNPDPCNGTRFWGCNSQPLEFSEVCDSMSFDHKEEDFKELLTHKETND